MKYSDTFVDVTKHARKIPTSEYQESGKYPIIDQGQKQIAGYTDIEEGLFTDVPAIIFGDHTRAIKYVDTPFYIGADGVKVIKCVDNDADYKYLFYLLSSVKIPDTGYNRHYKWLKEAVLPDHQKGEQIVINSTLSLIDELIIQNKSLIKKSEQLVKSRFVETFGTVNNNAFDYPVVRLGDYAKLQGGFAFKSKDFVDNGIPLVQIGNVNKDYLDWEVINSVPNEYVDRYSEFLLHDGDLVMAMTRPIIKSLNSVKIAKVAKSDTPCLLNQRVGRFVLSSSLNRLFLETLCKSDDFKDYVERMSGNSLQPNISSKQVEDYLIILPPIELQNQFAEFVTRIEKQKVTVQKSIDKLETLKKSLMQDYFG